MDYKDAVTQLFERSNAMQSYWGFYITVSAALIGFFGTARRPVAVTRVLVGLFIVVASVNLNGISDVARQRAMLRGLLEKTFVVEAPDDLRLKSAKEIRCCKTKETQPASSLLENTPSLDVQIGYLSTVHPPPVWGVVVTHLLFDLTIIISILFLQRGQRDST